LEAHKVTSALSGIVNGTVKWTPELVAEKASIGGLGPVGVGSAATVADELERWIEEADVDGFNCEFVPVFGKLSGLTACLVGYVTTPGTFEDVVELLVPELRTRGLYAQIGDRKDGLTAREKVYGEGQAKLRDDHIGSGYKYDVYKEDPPTYERNGSKLDTEG
jgi:hypothetical protein